MHEIIGSELILYLWMQIVNKPCKIRVNIYDLGIDVCNMNHESDKIDYT